VSNRDRPSLAAFRVAVLLYPPRFRARFATAMLGAFADCRAEAAANGAIALSSFYFRTFFDAVRSAAKERINPVLPDPRPPADEQVDRPQRGAFLDALLQDTRFAVRSLLKRPAFTIVSVVALALGIGATTAIFSAVNGVLLHRLPYKDPDSLVRMLRVREAERRTAMSLPDLRDIQEQVPSLEWSAGYSQQNVTLTGLGEAELISGATVTDGLLAVFAEAPALGRDIRADEAIVGGPRVIVIGYRFWQDRLGGRSDVIGETVELSDPSFEIVGVAPAGFDFPAGTELWAPNYLGGMEGCGRGCHTFGVIARLAAGAAAGPANEELEVLAVRLQEAYPEDNYGKSFVVESLEDSIVGGVRAGLLVLLGAVGMVLLIACANVANLLLIRASGRAGEVAVRFALGAGRARIVRQLLVEAGVLAGLGGVFGLLLAAGGVQVLLALAPADLPRASEVRVDLTVLSFAMATVAVVSLFFGLAPALRLARAPLTPALQRAGRNRPGSARGNWMRSALLTTEVALSVMLLLGAGLLARSFSRLNAVELGFETESVVRFSLSLPESRYPEPDAGVRFFETIEETIASLPGVESVGSVFGSPLGHNDISASVVLRGQPPVPPGQEPDAIWHAVSPGYFRTLRIPLLSGRDFQRGDRPGSQRVVIVSETFARRLYPGEDPLGKEVDLGVSFGYPEERPRTIIGVVGDVRFRALTRAPEPETYVPMAQAGPDYMTIVVRTFPGGSDVVAAIRDEVRALDDALPLRYIETMRMVVDRELGSTRFYMLLLMSFAGVALVLASVGLYGVVGFIVAQRTHEIAVRMSLGARRRDVILMVLRQGVWPVAVGIVAGLVAAQLGSKVLASLLYGIEPTDPVAFAGATTTLLAVALLALVVPASKASRISPMAALKQD